MITDGTRVSRWSGTRRAIFDFLCGLHIGGVYGKEMVFYFQKREDGFFSLFVFTPPILITFCFFSWDKVSVGQGPRFLFFRHQILYLFAAALTR